MTTTTLRFWRAMIRGDEVAVAKAIKDGTYHEGPWKTAEQAFFDFQQVGKETPEMEL